MFFFPKQQLPVHTLDGWLNLEPAGSIPHKPDARACLLRYPSRVGLENHTNVAVRGNLALQTANRNVGVAPGEADLCAGL